MKFKIIYGFISIAALYGCSQDAPQKDANLSEGSGLISATVPDELHAYLPKRGLKRRVAALSSQNPGILVPKTILLAASVNRPQPLQGQISIPVLMLKYKDTGANPVTSGEFQDILFDPTVNSGSVTEYYREVSRNNFTLTGDVHNWVTLSNNAKHYTGECRGIFCTNPDGGMNTKFMRRLVNETLVKHDTSVNFSAYDNDGPDNIPNSGDDDGFVDFVALVHPTPGGECGHANDKNFIWSHKFSINDLKETLQSPSYFTTNDLMYKDHPNDPDRFILVDEYVIQPSLSCKATSNKNVPNEIGVFAHEFGHAFGLPDLYDAPAPIESEGIGGWGLMASGSYGGDGISSNSPTHMIGWSKEYLGWVSPIVITQDTKNVIITPVSEGGNVIKVDYTNEFDPEDGRYLLIENRTKTGFDTSLVGEGLIITAIDNDVIINGMPDNSVNDQSHRLGINVIEADGNTNLHSDLFNKGNNRGDVSDLFGINGFNDLDVSHVEPVLAALCNIQKVESGFKLDIYVSRVTCPDRVRPGGGSTPVPLQIEDLLRYYQETGELIQIEGILKNKGSNYFTDRELVISTEQGDINVSAWLPLSAEGGSDAMAPKTMQDILGRKVLISGLVGTDRIKGVGEKAIVKVDTAVVQK